MRLGTGLTAGAATGRLRPGSVMVPIASAGTRGVVAPGSKGAHWGGHAGAVRAVRVVAGVLHGSRRCSADGPLARVGLPESAAC